MFSLDTGLVILIGTISVRDMRLPLDLRKGGWEGAGWGIFL